MASKPRLYPNRLNQDVSFDSIGLTCFATISGAKPDGQLAELNNVHVRDSAFLAERGILTLAKSPRQATSNRPGGNACNHNGNAA